MKRTRLPALIFVGALASLSMTVGHAQEPSSKCTAPVPTSATPLGVGVLQEGGGTSGTLAVCSAGPLPVHGAATLSGDATTQSGYIDLDGDSTNQGCGKGFIRTDGMNWYDSPTGSWSSSSPKEGPGDVVQHTVTNCSG